jgi:Cu-Zn family superoxide dismutase
MRAAILAACWAVPVLGTGCSHAGSPAAARPLTSGTLRNAGGEPVGVATLTDAAGALQLGVSVGGLSPGPHGIHLHAEGSCTPPDFTSAGPHFNPTGRQHGRLNPAGPHVGDLPNLIVGPDSSADTTFVVAPALRAADRAALVVHAGADDERTDPSGNSGARLACAVLRPPW